MARINDQGLIEPDNGDVKVVVNLRQSYYGALQTASGKPELAVIHLTGHYLPFGANDAITDGTVSMTGRVVSGAASYYAHVYISRDGTAYQVVPFTRAAKHAEGSYQGREINRIAVGIEHSNMGWVRPNGVMPKRSGIDISRSDLELVGTLYWQRPTEEQLRASGAILRALGDWAGIALDDLVRGHHELSKGDHIDPGPFFTPEKLLPFAFGRPRIPWAPILFGTALAATMATVIYLHRTGTRHSLITWPAPQSA